MNINLPCDKYIRWDIVIVVIEMMMLKDFKNLKKISWILITYTILIGFETTIFAINYFVNFISLILNHSIAILNSKYLSPKEKNEIITYRCSQKVYFVCDRLVISCQMMKQIIRLREE